MDDSKNFGFCVLPDGKVRVRLFTEGVYDIDGENELPDEIARFIRTVKNDYSYLY